MWKRAYLEFSDHFDVPTTNDKGANILRPGNAVMIVVGTIFISLAILKDYEPLLLLPIGFGVIVGNIPYLSGMALSVYDDGRDGGGLQNTSVLSFIYFGVKYGLFPPLIFLGIGAMLANFPSTMPVLTPWLASSR